MLSRKIGYVLGVLLLGALAISACGPGGGGTTSGTGQTVSVEAGEFYYKPDLINAKPGEPITVSFKNAGTVEHTFVIKDLNFKLVAQPGQTVRGTFTAPTTPGAYEIHCDIAGHTEAGMQAKLTVAAPSN